MGACLLEAISWRGGKISRRRGVTVLRVWEVLKGCYGGTKTRHEGGPEVEVVGGLVLEGAPAVDGLEVGVEGDEAVARQQEGPGRRLT